MTKTKLAAAVKDHVQELLWPSHPSVSVGSTLKKKKKGRWSDWLSKKSEGKEEYFVAKGG